jgi:hypothetical protein
MRFTITTWTGFRTDAILLAVDGTRMRLALPGAGDACEFSLRGGQWFSEEGEPVEIVPVQQEAGPETQAYSDCSPVEPLAEPVAIWVN